MKINQMLGISGQRHIQARTVAAASNGGQIPTPTPEEAAAAQAQRRKYVA
jgi:hypothetical protein